MMLITERAENGGGRGNLPRRSTHTAALPLLALAALSKSYAPTPLSLLDTRSNKSLIGGTEQRGLSSTGHGIAADNQR